MILGDLNASGAYYSMYELQEIRKTTLPYTWIIPDNAGTNTSPKDLMAFDRMIAIDGLAGRYNDKWMVDKAFSYTDATSDHWPVWAEFDFSINVNH